jgi:hypothetical protein
MLGRKVVKGKQDFFIFLQAFARFWEFALITGNELIVGCQSRLASWCQVHFMDQLLGLVLNALGHFIKDIGRLMHPATLLCDCSVFFLQSDPEAKRTIADRQLRRSGKSISADSLYEAGLRSGAWVKVKLTKA